jgi:hypothetical protein
MNPLHSLWFYLICIFNIILPTVPRSCNSSHKLSSMLIAVNCSKYLTILACLSDVFLCVHASWLYCYSCIKATSWHCLSILCIFFRMNHHTRCTCLYQFCYFHTTWLQYCMIILLYLAVPSFTSVIPITACKNNQCVFSYDLHLYCMQWLWAPATTATMALGSTQPLTEMSTRGISFGGGGEGEGGMTWLVSRADNLATFLCRMSRNSGSINLLAP